MPQQVHPISWIKLFRAQGGCSVALGTVALMIFTGLSVARYHNDSYIAENAILVEAEILQQRMMSDGKTFAPTTTFRVQRPEGELVLEFEGAPGWPKPIGSVIPLYLVEGDPDDPEYEPTYLIEKLPDPNARGWVLEMAALFIGVITLGYGGFAAIRTTGAIRARNFGAASTAKVVRVEVIKRWRWENLLLDRYAVGDRSYTAETDYFRVVFQDRMGRTCKSLPHHIWDIPGIEKDDELEVFEGIRQSWWIKDVGPRPIDDSPSNSNVPRVARNL